MLPKHYKNIQNHWNHHPCNWLLKVWGIENLNLTIIRQKSPIWNPNDLYFCRSTPTKPLPFPTKTRVPIWVSRCMQPGYWHGWCTNGCLSIDLTAMSCNHVLSRFPDLQEKLEGWKTSKKTTRIAYHGVKWFIISHFPTTTATTSSALKYSSTKKTTPNEFHGRRDQ